MSERVMRIVKLLLPNVDANLRMFATELVCDSIKNYCNVIEIPEGLYHVAASMVLDVWRQTQLGHEQLTQQVKGISRGDTSFTFASPAEQMQALVSSPTFARNYAPQLNAFRKLRW